MLFVPNYLDMESQLKIGKKVLQKYMKVICNAGIIKLLGRTDRRGNNCYAAAYIGTRRKNEDTKTKREWFLRNCPEIRKALAAFTLR